MGDIKGHVMTDAVNYTSLEFKNLSFLAVWSDSNMFSVSLRRDILRLGTERGLCGTIHL